MVYTSGVAQGHHDVEINVNGTVQEFRFFGAVISMSVTSLSDSTQIVEKPIDDQDPLWDIAPERGPSGWQYSNDSRANGLLGNGHIWTCIYSATRSASYTFTNTGAVILRGPVGINVQGYSVDLDEGTTALDATSVWPDYRPDPRSGVLFFRGGLNPLLPYTITLRNFNPKFPQSDSLYYLPSNQHLTGFCANLDAGLVLLAGDGDATPTGTRTTTQNGPRATEPTLPAATAGRHTALIVGAVFGAVVAAGIIFVAAFAVVRRRRRALRRSDQAFPLTPAPEPRHVRSEKLRAIASALPGAKRRRSTWAPDASLALRRSESESAGASAPVTSDATASSRRRLDEMPPEILGRLLNLVAVRMDGEGDASAPSPGDAVSETTALPPRYRW
ncbi:hypothetical protein AURDEDRAFT_183332 [Auricularia subglabra TFB-10046 SS5]|nr:hypothetical protein AURDEDRAFT_183332 [Auricularia subglabra TFB-10046 SS5]